MGAGVVITQLIYLHPGKQEVFEAFEAVARGVLGRYGGELLLRCRGERIAGTLREPDEIHVVRFPDEGALQGFLRDPERAAVMGWKEEAVREVVTVREG